MAAIVCPNCQFSNPHGALFCKQCYALLIDTVPVGAQTIALPKKTVVQIADTSQLRSQRLLEAQNLKTHSVALYIDVVQSPLIVLLPKQAIMGRGVSSDDQLRVDLSPFGAANRGVSRQHLILKRTVGGEVAAEDMGSSNGTWLNEVLLQPYRAAVLASGDNLRLGKLDIAVYLPN